MTSTSQPGYGWAHQQRARALKDAMRDGDPCCRCGRALYRWQLDLDRSDPRGIDADHWPVARVQGGQLPNALACRPCNRGAGAALGNRLRTHRPPIADQPPRPALPEW